MGIKIDPTILDPQTNLQSSTDDIKGLVIDDSSTVYQPQTLFYDSMNFTDVYTDPLSKYKKYDVVTTRFTDWDEMRARNQSTGEKWLNGLSKAAVTTLGAVAENTLGVLFGLGELATGGAYYDNWVGKTVDKGNEWMRESMPNYMTRAEQEATTLQKLGTANFWADTVANGFGYSLGSVATLALTGGTGLLTRGASLAAKGARSMGIYNTSKAIANATKVAQQTGRGASSFLNPTRAGIKNTLKVAEVGVMMSLAEASVEARETQKHTYDDLIQKVIEDPDNNISSINDFTENQLQEIEHASYAAGNRNFLTQLPVLAGTNLLMFGKGVAGYKGPSKWNKDVAFDNAAFKAVSQLEGRSRYRNALSRMKPTGAGVVTEAGQEGWQFASNIFSTDYHTNKYFNSGVADLTDSMFKGVEDLFGTQEGLESMLVGAIVGGGTTMVRSTIKQDFKNRKNRAKYAADVINGGYFANTADKTQNTNAAILMVKEMEAARQAGDIKRFKDAQYKFIQYQAMNSLDHGTFNVFMDRLEDSKSLSDEEFAKQFGFDHNKTIQEQTKTTANPDGKTKSEVINDVQTKLLEFETSYERINEMFPPGMKSSPVARMFMSKEEREAEDNVERKRDILRKELILTASGMQDRNRRLDKIQEEMQSILADANKINGIPMIEEDFRLRSILTEPAPENLEDLDASKRVKTAREKINDVYKKLQLKARELNNSGAAAQIKPFEDAAKDYLGILEENLKATESYNKLISDEYFQDLFTEDVKDKEAAAKQRAEEEKAKEIIDTAKEAKDVKVNEDASQEVKNAADTKARKLKTAEEKAKKFWLKRVDKYKTIDEKLADLKAIDPKGIENDAKRAGLAAAVKVLENIKKGNNKSVPEAGNPEEKVVESMDLETTTEENNQVVEQISLEENENEEETLTIGDSNILLADGQMKTESKVPNTKDTSDQLNLFEQDTPREIPVSEGQLEITLASNPQGTIITTNPDGTTKSDLVVNDAGVPTVPEADTVTSEAIDKSYEGVFGTKTSLRSLTDEAASEAKLGAKSQKGVDPNTLTYEEAQKQFDAMLEFIEKRIKMNEVLREKGKPIMSAKQINDEVHANFIKAGVPGSILQYIVSYNVQELRKYIKNRVDQGVVQETEKSIPINQDLLLDDNIIGTEVEFEIIENDYWKSGARTRSEDWMEIPIYVKIGDQYIGMLKASESKERQVIVDKLQKGQKVTTNISSTKASNYNNAVNEDTNERSFSDPRVVFGDDNDVLLVFTTVSAETGIPSHTLGEVDPSKDKGDLGKIRANVENKQDAQVDQIGVVIRSKHNPEAFDRIAYVSTANLSEDAQLTALEALKQRNYETIKEIVSHSKILEGANKPNRKGAKNNTSFLEINKFGDEVNNETGEVTKEGLNYIVYWSNTLGSLVRINEVELIKAFNGDTAYYNEVEVNQDERYTVNKKGNTSVVDINFEADIKDFLSRKKYNVRRDIANLNTPYTSLITGKTYENGYQDYLFSDTEIGGERVEGQGHNSIVSTDLVKRPESESLFHNPEVKFEKGNILGETAPEIIKNTKMAETSPEAPVAPKSKNKSIEDLFDNLGGIDPNTGKPRKC